MKNEPNQTTGSSYGLPWPAEWTKAQYVAALHKRAADLRQWAQEARARASHQEAEADGLTLMAEEVEAAHG